MINQDCEGRQSEGKRPMGLAGDVKRPEVDRQLGGMPLLKDDRDAQVFEVLGQRLPAQIDVMSLDEAMHVALARSRTARGQMPEHAP